MTDSASGAIWTHPALAYDNALLAPYTNLLNRDVSTNLQSGILHGYAGDKAVLGIVAGRVLGNFTGTGGLETTGGDELRFAMGGDATIGGVYLAPGHPSDSVSSPMHCRIGPNATTSSRTGTIGSTSTINNTDFIWVFKYVPGSGVTLFEIWNMDGAVIFSAPTLEGTTTFTGSMGFPAMRFSGFKMYGSAFYEMSALPSTTDLCVRWSANAWKNGHRFLYPSSEWL